MTSRREQIIAAVAATVATVPGASHYRSRADAFTRAEAPATVTAPSRDNPAVPRVSTCYIDWTLVLQVAVNTRGLVPDSLADPLLVAIHAALMADRSIGGLATDVRPGQVDWQIEKADLASGWVTQDWIINYRTGVNSLE
jgi:hypothetical protein